MNARVRVGEIFDCLCALAFTVSRDCIVSRKSLHMPLRSRVNAA
jgi:hypothetical protein